MNRFLRFLPTLLILTIPACATTVDDAEPHPTRAEIIGTYYMGHAGFAEGLDLHDDGSYTRTLYGHLGQSDVTFKGSWLLEGKYLNFKPDPAKPMISDLVQAETFFYHDEPAFVRTQDLKKGKVGEWWVYQRDTNK
jgi:hypothetical protein